mgnify:CR=1 FL=1
MSFCLLSDEFRPESQAVVKQLMDKGYKCYLMTGDHKSSAESLGALLGLPKDQIFSEQSPEMKQAILKAHPQSLMVGDGINDSVALATSKVGLAVQGSMEASLKAADIYLTEPSLRGVNDVLRLGHETRRVLRRNLLFSLSYNVAGAAAALAGLINPLVAAILMPLSSATVLTLSAVGTSFLRSWGAKGSRYLEDLEKTQPSEKPSSLKNEPALI